jgi:hypothetical protein
VARRGGASTRPGSGGVGTGRHVDCLRAALEWGDAQHMAGRVAAAARRETEEEGER